MEQLTYQKLKSSHEEITGVYSYWFSVIISSTESTPLLRSPDGTENNLIRYCTCVVCKARFQYI